MATFGNKKEKYSPVRIKFRGKSPERDCEQFRGSGLPEPEVECCPEAEVPELTEETEVNQREEDLN